ncbi:Spy/CpxP family protein refolding chaperone [Desulfolutivibrio sp.]|uniref:Spy/CpxP family protein refolding chaperone n=1 Tax=Desulfolutivibrio sp. TaxID=2773296 RepID=UPI002F966A7C
MRINMKTLFLIAAVMFCVANLAQAQPGGPDGPGGPGGHDGPPPFMMPGVSPEKCQVIDRIMDETETKLFPLIQEFKVLKAKLEALVVDVKSDEAAIAAQIEEISKVRTALEKVKVEARRKVIKETGVILPPGGPGGHSHMGPPGFPG